MNPRVTLVVVAIFALLFGYLYFVELNKTPEQLGTPVPTLQPGIFSLASSNVKSIEVRELRAAHQVILSRSGDGWQVTAPENKPADSGAIDTAVSQLASLQASRVLTNVTSLASFGLVTATLEVRMVMSDTTPYALTIGDKTPDGSNYYAAYTGDKSKVFIVSTSAIDTLMGWITAPPYQPTPTPTATPGPTGTPTVEGTGTISPTTAPPNLVPTVALPPAAATPTP